MPTTSSIEPDHPGQAGKPRIIIIDIASEVLFRGDILNGVELVRRVSSVHPNLSILIVSDAYHATKYHNQLIRAGARAFCLKESKASIILEAVEATCDSLPFADPSILKALKQSPKTTGTVPSVNLTDREIEVLIRLDLRDKEIAEELDMKLRTVEKHIECILAKLKAPTRTHAALKAMQMGLVLLPIMTPRIDPREQVHPELHGENPLQPIPPLLDGGSSSWTIPDSTAELAARMRAARSDLDNYLAGPFNIPVSSEELTRLVALLKRLIPLEDEWERRKNQ